MPRDATLSKLSSLLRSPDQWPANFVWDYTRPGCCADVLCRRLNNHNIKILDDETRGKIFVFADRHHPKHPKFSEVTPGHVADLIDLHLRGEM
jgi:hypothetical protein